VCRWSDTKKKCVYFICANVIKICPFTGTHYLRSDVFILSSVIAEIVLFFSFLNVIAITNITNRMTFRIRFCYRKAVAMTDSTSYTWCSIR